MKPKADAPVLVRRALGALYDLDRNPPMKEPCLHNAFRQEHPGQIDYVRLVPQCEGCHAHCCKLNTIVYPEEYDKYETQPYERPLSGVEERILKKNEDGMCIYWREGKCSIYKDRPKSCRQWDCRFQGGPDEIYRRVNPPADDK